MGLLDDIEAAAVDDDAPLEPALRRCLQLASRADAPGLRDWAHHELTGYPKDVALPSYRDVPARPKAQVMNLNATGTIPVPFDVAYTKAAPEDRDAIRDFSDRFSRLRIRDSIAFLIAHSGPEGTLTVGWPAAQAARVVALVSEWDYMSGWSEARGSTADEIISQVRTRLLTFVLELRGMGIGDADTALEPADKVAVGNAVTQVIINGGMNTINATNIWGVAPGDDQGLRRTLERLGVREDEAETVALAIREEDPKEPGAVEKLKTRVGNVVEKVGAAVAVELAKAYWGIG